MSMRSTYCVVVSIFFHFIDMSGVYVDSIDRFVTRLAFMGLVGKRRHRDTRATTL